MERDLVRRAQTRDHDAFAMLARDALERLYGTAYLILLDQDRARDAARDALIAAWRDIRGLPETDAIEPWLQGILIRTCQRVAAPGAGSMADDGESRRAFASLTRDERTILALVFFAEFSVPDASVALGVPPGAAETRRREALDALRVALSLDDTAESKVDLEWRLRSWLANEAAPPDLTTVSEAITAATLSTAQRRRPMFAARGREPDRRATSGTRRRTGRRLGVALGITLVTGVALIAAVGGGMFVTRVVRPPDQAKQSPAPGQILTTGDISVVAGPLYRPTIALLVDGRVLIVGLGDSLIGGIIYDPATGTYGEPIRDPVLRRGSTATTLQNSLVLLTGGSFGESDVGSVTAVLFDPVSTTFATTNPLSIARIEHTATLLDDGRVLIAGGTHRVVGSPPIVAEGAAELYDPATGTFGLTGTMVRPRAGQTATKLRDGRVLIAGGFGIPETGARTFPAPAEIFDPATGQFHATGAMNTPRGDQSATLLADGRVLIVGGTDRFGGEGEAQRTIPGAEVFDPVAETFTPVGSLVTERAGHSATLLADGRVLVAGGRNERGEPRSTEIFDPTSGSFAAGPVARAPHNATIAPLIADGRVLLTGSGPGASEVFDPLAGAVAAVPSPSPGARPFKVVATNVLRSGPQLVRLDDGRILIVGGWGATDGQPVAGAEIFDPSTGLMSPAGTLLDRLTEMAATRLPDGRVFIGGNDDNGAGIAEIFDPVTVTFEPAPVAYAGLLRDRHPLATSGLAAGRLVLSDGFDRIQSFDAATGTIGPQAPVCEYPWAGVALDASRVLVTCGEVQAVIADLAAGTTEQTDLRFDRAVPLDGRRIALALGAYRFGDPGAGAPQTDRITEIYDPTDRSVQELREHVGIGETVLVVGDRVYAFGGYTFDGSPSDASVVIDTRSWTSTDLGPMLAPRSGASVIVLRDGRILIVGGARQSPDRTDPIPPGAELFDPSLLP